MNEFTPHLMPRYTGWIEVIAGCMFSGKTEELIRRLRRAKIAKQEVRIFKPLIDNRYSSCDIVSHSEQSLPSVLIEMQVKFYHNARKHKLLVLMKLNFLELN